MQGDRVKVAFDDHNLLGLNDPLACYVEAIESPALAE